MNQNIQIKGDENFLRFINEKTNGTGYGEHMFCVFQTVINENIKQEIEYLGRKVGCSEPFETGLILKRKGADLSFGDLNDNQIKKMLLALCDKYSYDRFKGIIKESIESDDYQSLAKALKNQEGELSKCCRRLLQRRKVTFPPLGVYIPQRQVIELYYETIFDAVDEYGPSSEEDRYILFEALLQHVFAHEYFHAMHHQMAPFYMESQRAKNPKRICQIITESLAEYYAWNWSQEAAKFGSDSISRAHKRIAEHSEKSWHEQKPYFWPYDYAKDYKSSECFKAELKHSIKVASFVR